MHLQDGAIGLYDAAVGVGDLSVDGLVLSSNKYSESYGNGICGSVGSVRMTKFEEHTALSSTGAEAIRTEERLRCIASVELIQGLAPFDDGQCFGMRVNLEGIHDGFCDTFLPVEPNEFS